MTRITNGGCECSFYSIILDRESIKIHICLDSCKSKLCHDILEVNRGSYSIFLYYLCDNNIGICIDIVETLIYRLYLCLSSCD